MKSCKEGSSWAQSPQAQQRKGEAMEDSVTWADSSAAGDDGVERTGRGLGPRSQDGWQSQAAGRQVQLLGAARRPPPRFSSGS